ncbi:MAG: proline--tRNA ligase, partial [Candidatus Eremiobacteraeota bacterium]|nr:proline--tRNA ligase [Candidatus Eremiobacteraeota bacterium]
ITRIVSGCIEKWHDKDGIIWPMSIAPYHVIVMPVLSGNEDQMSAAERLYRELLDRNVEVLLDDRDLRPGVKFKDADLLGFPIRAMIGDKALARDAVEIRIRADGTSKMVPKNEAADYISGIIEKEVARLNNLRTAQEEEAEYVRVGW